MTKHYKEVTLASGLTVYGFNPSSTLRRKLGYRWEQYKTAAEAIARAQEATAAFAQYKRTGALPQTVEHYNVSGLIDAYKRTSRWRQIARVTNSRRAYEQAMRSIIESIGSQPVATINPLWAEDLYQRLCDQHSTAKANSMIKMLNIVWAMPSDSSSRQTIRLQSLA